MSGRGFGSLVMAASVAGAALGCYLVSLTVASERSELESVEAQIVHTQREIRVLQTEIGTRGRLAQLERWNANFIRLSAPSADQILQGSFQLASMVKPPSKPALDAPMVLASAPIPARPGTAAARPAGARPDQLMQVASYTVPVREERASPKAAPPKPPEAAKVEPRKAEGTKAEPNRPAPAKTAPIRLAETKTKVGKPKTRSSAADPLAPLPTARAPAKDSGTAR